MIKKIFCVITLLCVAVLTGEAQPASKPQPQPLYPTGGMPGYNGLTAASTADDGVTRFAIAEPDYMVFLPDKARQNGQCVIVCPGGGYGCVCYQREGIEVAQWLNTFGTAAVVLRYRMPNGHSRIPLTDVCEMFRTVRAHAAEWNIDPQQVGIMGFSAGGHLAATAATQTECAEAHPAFAVLIYPVITFTLPYAHLGTRKNLTGADSPSAELVARYSCEQRVTDATSPCFIALSDDDQVVSPQNSTMFYNALKDHNVAAELHIYPTGQHGWIGPFHYWDEYHASLARWLSQQRDAAQP